METMTSDSVVRETENGFDNLIAASQKGKKEKKKKLKCE